jgi:hypothetical protein
MPEAASTRARSIRGMSNGDAPDRVDEFEDHGDEAARPGRCR